MSPIGITSLLLSIFGVLFAVSFLFTILMGATRAFRPKLINAHPAYAVESVSFRSRHGVMIRAWWHVGDAQKPVILFCHGVGGNRADLNRLTAHFAAAGFGIFTFDFRGHGESGGWKTSFGLMERWDIVEAVKHLKESGKLAGRPLGIYGLSMGAASVVLAAAAVQRIYPPSAVALDSSFARFAPIIRVSVQEWPVLARALFLPLVTFVGNHIFQVPALIINPVARIPHIAPARLLIIHSRHDELIPIEHAQRLFAAAKQPKELWELEGALHGESFIQFGEAYARKLMQHFSPAAVASTQAAQT